MRNIEIDRVGKVIAGEDLGKWIKIQDVTESTGGFLVLYGVDRDFENGGDDWVEDWDSLVQYFTESSWEIEWEKVQAD